MIGTTPFGPTHEQLYQNAREILHYFQDTEILIKEAAPDKRQKKIDRFFGSMYIPAYWGLERAVAQAYKNTQGASPQILKIQEKLSKATLCCQSIERLAIQTSKASQIYTSHLNIGSDENSSAQQSSEDFSTDLSGGDTPYIQLSGKELYTEPLEQPSSEGNLKWIYDLEEISSLLSDEASTENFDQAKEQFKRLETKGQLKESIADLCYLHLQSIHNKRKEQSEVGESYGKGAMMGQYFATHLERRRAIQRAILCLTVIELENGVKAGQKETIETMLEILDGLKIASEDLPPNQNNLAHTLFGHMYHLHLEDRKENSHLIDPNDSQFHSKFGEEAFFCFEPQMINANTKMAAFQALWKDLLKTWKMEDVK